MAGPTSPSLDPPPRRSGSARPPVPAGAIGRRTHGLSAGEAVLGLVIEQPDSATRLCQRLQERFRSARFTHSTAHNALTRLTRQGLVRPVRAGGGPDLERRFEATERGRAYFHAWMCRASPAAPTLREELLAKLEFCAPEDLARLIEAIACEERACASMFAAAQGRLSGEELLHARPVAPREHWAALMRRATLREEAAIWGMRFKRLERLRTRLEGLSEEAEQCAREDAGQAVGVGQPAGAAVAGARGGKRRR
jgi:DNA-binding PadR family transcriptional regulator